MATARIFHLAYYGYEATVIDSQLITPALRLASDGVDVRPVFMEGFRAWFKGDWRAKADALSRLGLRAAFFPRVPRNFFAYNTLRIEHFLKPHLDAGPVVVHARGVQGAAAVVPLKKYFPRLRVICDIRGMDAAEYRLEIETRTGRALRPWETYWERRLKAMEIDAVRKSDAVLCVSRSMIPRFSAAADVPTEKFDYVPCAMDGATFTMGLAQRNIRRAEMGLEGKLVFVYAGSLSVWQIPGRMLAIAARALALQPDAAFLALTPQPEDLLRQAAAAGLPLDRVRALRVAHADVPSYLAAGDIGLLLREENDVNKFACPTKYAEYVGCGLHVLATPAVDEVAESIRTTGAGTLLVSLDDAAGVDAAVQSAVVAARDSRRPEFAAAAALAYDWSSHLPTLKKWYLRLSSESSR